MNKMKFEESNNVIFLQHIVIVFKIIKYHLRDCYRINRNKF